MAARGGSELERGHIEVAGVRRSYWLARAPRRAGGQAAPPLLVALHGSGMDGRAMDHFTGLAKRGPAAGITTVFPDGWKGAWHPARPPAGQPDLDDARFLAELTTHMERIGAARSWPVFLTGVSQGARYAEHVARHGLLPVTGLFLVAGTGLEFSRRQVPVPQLRASMILVLGTGDRTTPYTGGRLTRRGLTGRLLRRRAARHGELPGEDIVSGAEQLVADWAAANGITATDGVTGINGVPGSGSAGNGTAGSGNGGGRSAGAESTAAGVAGGGITRAGGIVTPLIEELPMVPGDPPVTRKTWTKPGAHPVTLYRIDGGGHGWPGGPQLRPARAVGPVAKHLDATGLLLDMAERETATALGRPGPGRSEIT